MIVRFGDFVFHRDRRQLMNASREIHLTPKAFDLLAELIDRAPAVVAKAELHRRLWPETFVSDATLVGLVKELRRALGDGRCTIIRTAHRVGYAFDASLDAGEPAAPPTHWIIAGTQQFHLRPGANVIGRDPAATIRLDVPGVSRQHAQIVVDGETATLEDLGSKNGTLVADRPARGRVELRNGDRIQIASERLVFNASTAGLSTLTQPTRLPSGE